MSWLERLRDIHEEDWQPVSVPAFAAASMLFAGITWLANTGPRWVWILDNANLAFHEAGHPIFGAIAEPLRVYGGTLGQLAFPIVTTAVFWSRRQPVGCAACAVWLCQNFWNIAVYMSDARAMQLPLVGGLSPELYHDWNEILYRWKLLRWDTTLAFLLRIAAWAGVVAAWAWLGWRCWQDRAEGREPGMD